MISYVPVVPGIAGRLTRALVPSGAFVAAVGADNPDKSEPSPDVLAGATIVVDILGQAATLGDTGGGEATGLRALYAYLRERYA